MSGSRVHILGLLLGVLLLKDAIATPEDPFVSYDFLYNEGVNSYLEENWEKCVENIEGALRDWHWWRENVAK